MKRAMALYGSPVCRKCYYGFANLRQLAFFLDIIAWRMVLAGVGFTFGMVIGLTMPNASDAALSVIVLSYLVVMWSLFLMKDGFSGMSPGKLICGVQVLNENTMQPASFLQSFRRNLPLLIPLMPIVVAFMLLKGKRLGDSWSHSRVVWRKYRDHPVFSGALVCRSCGYDLIANQSGVCPECGTQFQPVAPPVLPLPSEPATAVAA